MIFKNYFPDKCQKVNFIVDNDNVLSEIKEQTEIPEHFTKCKYYVL